MVFVAILLVLTVTEFQIGPIYLYLYLCLRLAWQQQRLQKEVASGAQENSIVTAIATVQMCVVLGKTLSPQGLFSGWRILGLSDLMEGTFHNARHVAQYPCP